VKGSELHAEAGVWRNHRGLLAALLMEGEAPDRSNGGAPEPDALYRVVLASGLRLTTDLDHLDQRPVPGWRLLVDPDGALTLTWPHFNPLLDHVPLDLPEGWLRLAEDQRLVEVFVGWGLGMHEHAYDREAHPLQQVWHAAENGTLAGGAVALEDG
jgi:hypothetical protein